MSCTVIIKNNAGPAVFTILVANDQPEGKGEVVFSDAINSRDQRPTGVSHRSMRIGISAKQYQQGEVVGPDILTNTTEFECNGGGVTVEWRDNRFYLSYSRG